MAEIFISYKREDETRVGKLVTALQQAGQSLWWDRGLPGSESWRENIQRELDGAKVVIVCWTRASVGSAGDFVRDEAGRAKERGILIPVLLEPVRPPLGFGELQAIDLSHWRGSLRDPFFGDLLAVIESKRTGAPAPSPKGPMRRLMRRLTIGSIASALAAGIFGFSMNALRIQDQACTLSIGQPGLSDVCGALGLGGRPSREARLAWEALPPNDCQALRGFRERFEASPLRALADSRLASRRIVSVEQWIESDRQDPVLFEPASGAPLPSQSAAQAAAITRAQLSAERLCRAFGASSIFRYRGARPVAETWRCERSEAGYSCGFEGRADCDLQERRVSESEVCGN